MAATDGMVKGVDFVAFQTKDFDRAMTFYGETLGLPRSVHVPDRGFAEFETGNLTLSIIDSEKMGMEHQASVGPVALHVDDVAQARGAAGGARASSSAATCWTPGCATWRSSMTRTATR